jgi:methylmalonyl-CoA/ethylmalonyl-CoA epimerase
MRKLARWQSFQLKKWSARKAVHNGAMGMIKRIIEIGVAVRDLAMTGNSLIEILGAREGKPIRAKEFNMVAQMFRVGNIEFELMEPSPGKGIIADFVKKRGEGLHHLAFEVEDMDATLDWVKKQNVKIISEILVNSTKAAFLHPASFKGVLIELIEGIVKNVDNTILPTDLQTQGHGGGIGAEGILEVGIFANDLEAVRDFYSKIFLCETPEISDVKPLSLRIATCRVGNVCLKLMEIIGKRGYSNALFGKGQPGLNHVTLKVTNIQSAIVHLKSNGVDFEEDPMGLRDARSVLIHPKELCGVPIVLREGARHLAKN